MRRDKIYIQNLRNSGKSYSEISKLTGISKGTLSFWFKNSEDSKDIKKKLTLSNKDNSTIRLIKLNDIRGKKLQKHYEEAEKEALLDLGRFGGDKLFISGVLIYWGEGDKASKNGFRIANSDPKMLKIFYEFLTRICGVNSQKIRVSLLLYPDIDEKEALVYWSREIGISENHFTKSHFILGRHKTRKLSFGVCTMNASSTYLKRKMNVWLKTLPEMLLS